MEQSSSSAAGVIAPKVLIISMFDLEADAWLKREHPKFEVPITIPGLNPKYPDIWSTKEGDVCLLTTGESLLNAALGVCALTSSSRFDLRRTYFLIAGIAGVNPKWGTLGSVTFPRFAVQVDLQYEFDAREIPDDWTTGYVPQGASNPGEFPKIIYGTEVYELNNDLRQKMLSLTGGIALADSEAAVNYRKRFANVGDGVFMKATAQPSVIDGDVASSNVFFHGHLLAEGFEKVFELLTSGHGSYCMTNQEDNATLGALLRAALQGRVDFTRIMIIRSGSNFDRSINDSQRPQIPLHTNHGGLEPSLENLHRVGHVLVDEVVREWQSTYEQGIKPTNYVGDIFGSLGGTPDFGTSLDLGQHS